MTSLILNVLQIGLVLFLAWTVVKMVKTCNGALQDVIEELRFERQLLSLQKKLVSEINIQIGLQRQIMDKQLTMAMNSITAMKMMMDKESDPEWVRKFSEGRDNAKYN